MGDDGDQAIVVGRREHEHVGSEAHDHPLEAVEGGQVGGCGRGQHPHRPFEEVGIGPAQADLFGSGHRVAADEVGVVGFGHDRGLDAADVGHHGVAPATIVGQELAGHARHGRGRYGHEGDLGVGVVADRIDHALGQRLGVALFVGVEARHVPPPAAQAQGDGAADESGPDHERPAARRRSQSGRSSRSAWAPCR